MMMKDDSIWFYAWPFQLTQQEISPTHRHINKADAEWNPWMYAV